MSWKWSWTPVLLAALVGCGGEPSVASKSAAAFQQAQKEGKTFEGAGHEHGHGGHGGHEMPEAAPAETGGHQHQHGEAPAADHSDHSAMGHGGAQQHEGHAPAQQPHEGHGHAGHSRQPAAQGHEEHEGHTPAAEEQQGHEGHTPAAEEHQGHEHAGHSAPAPLPELPAEPESILQQDTLDAPAESSVLDARRSEEMSQAMGGHGHGTGSYRHADAGRGPEAHEGSEHHTPGAEHDHGAAVYVCPMHPEVTSDKPGTCPKCGMALVERKEEE